MKKKVAIIGSGIAGLTLASLLRTNSNFEFIVYEKGEILNLNEGFGIQLSVNSVFILNKIGFNTQTLSRQNLAHGIDPEGISKGMEFLKTLN